MLIGEYSHSIDAKGRLIIPSKFRLDLGESFVLSVGLDGCLELRSEKEWEAYCAFLLAKNPAKTRALQRTVFSQSEKCEADSQGRFVIPSRFREYAGLTRDVVAVGVSNKAEIWDKDKWESYKQSEILSPEEFAAAMEDIEM